MKLSQQWPLASYIPFLGRFHGAHRREAQGKWDKAESPHRGYTNQPPTGLLCAGLGGDNVARMIQVKAHLQF